MPANRFFTALMLSSILCACSTKQVPLTEQNQTQESNNRHLYREKQASTEIDHLIAQMTLDEKLSLLHANGKFSIAAVERLGIHEMWMSDGPHSVRREIQRQSWDDAGWKDDQSTYLPPLTMVAASWNRDMARLHGNVLGAEARHRRKDLILGPGVNLAQNPLNGRNFEYMGEDPYLAAQLVTEEIRAIQANDVGATVKHYALNTQELNRSNVDATPDERTLREVYLPAFEAAVKDGGVRAIMGSYNSVYGTNSNQNKLLTQDILRDEWQYPYILLTDWNVNINTHDAALNGLDIEMGTERASYQDYFFADPLKKAIETGEIPESVVDTKVRHILNAQYAMGMYDKHRLSGERNTKAHQRAALKIAEEGITLLKNDGLLPLDVTNIKRLLVVGPNVDQKHGSGGGSSEAKALYEITPAEGITTLLGKKTQVDVLRIGDKPEKMPIANDYVVSRHWTGTPSWNIDYYTDATRMQHSYSDWHADARLVLDTPTVLTMSAQIQPRATGVHTFFLHGPGSKSLRINKETLSLVATDSPDTAMARIELQADQQYTVAVDYEGTGELMLGWDSPDRLFSSLETALEAARQADAVIYVGGLSHSDDRESIDRVNLRLPGKQDEEIRALMTANKNTALLLIGGSPVEMPWIDDARAVLWGWYGGMEAGTAYARTLFGLNNPSGKLPMTFPAYLSQSAPIALGDYGPDKAEYNEGVFIGYRWFDQQKLEPLFPFGHGLSYTSFNYNNLVLSATHIKKNENLRVSADITNTGTRAGAEVVQLYLTDNEASVERPVRELKGFQKVSLAPGETKTVHFTITPRDRSFWDVKNHKWLAEDGQFTVSIAASSRDVRLTDQFVQGQ